jgi:hypothetical protein
MSNLLEQASLVMIPSGYKEDVVYSQIPLDGSGDLQMTRASNGTRVNSAGLVEVCPWNLLQQSETFDNAYWSKVNVSITSNSITAPNGTTTADLLTVTNNSALVEKTIASAGTTLFAFTPNTQYTFSCYYKKGSIDYEFRMLMYDGVSVTNSGLINLTTLSSSTVSYEDVGNGWYRFYHTFTSSASASSGYFYAVNYNYSTAITSGTNVYLWGAQVAQGSTAKPYFPTTDRLNVPRLTYQNGGGGCPSLLLEKQSTNVLRNSEDFSQSTWAKLRTSITANAITSPDGTQNADKAIANTDNSDHSVFDNTITSTSPATLSIYAKAGEYNYIFLGYDNGSASQGAFFNLSNGTISQNTSTLTASIQSVGNGWYRCVVSSGTSNWSTIYSIIALSENGTSFIFAGDGSKGIYIWGAQAEQSSYPTSYIPTTSASATRVADACFKTGISSLIGVNQGSIFVDFDALGVNLSVGNYLFDLSDGTNFDSNRIAVYWTDTNVLALFYAYGGTFTSIGLTANFATTKKIGVRWTSTQIQIVVNGVAQTAATYGNSSPTKLNLGSRFSDVERLDCKIKECVLFNTTLTTNELIALTS